MLAAELPSDDLQRQEQGKGSNVVWFAMYIKGHYEKD